MRTLRTTFVAVIALAVALLPVAGVVAQAAPSEGLPVLAKAECCPHAQSCETEAQGGQAKNNHANSGHEKGHCVGHDGCTGNCLCLGLTAVLPPALAEFSAALPVPKSGRAAEATASPAYMPPAPPPRI